MRPLGAFWGPANLLVGHAAVGCGEGAYARVGVADALLDFDRLVSLTGSPCTGSHTHQSCHIGEVSDVPKQKPLPSEEDEPDINMGEVAHLQICSLN